jgi:hypothetical protein
VGRCKNGTTCKTKKVSCQTTTLKVRSQSNGSNAAALNNYRGISTVASVMLHNEYDGISDFLATVEPSHAVTMPVRAFNRKREAAKLLSLQVGT